MEKGDVEGALVLLCWGFHFIPRYPKLLKVPARNGGRGHVPTDIDSLGHNKSSASKNGNRYTM